MNSQDDQDKVAQILAHGYYTGGSCRGKGIAQEDHTCPYAEDINDDHTTLCNCCEVCQHECAMDI